MSLDAVSLHAISQELSGAIFFKLREGTTEKNALELILQVLIDFQTRNVYRDQDTKKFESYRLNQLSLANQAQVISKAFLLLKQKRLEFEKPTSLENFNNIQNERKKTKLFKEAEEQREASLKILAIIEKTFDTNQKELQSQYLDRQYISTISNAYQDHSSQKHQPEASALNAGSPHEMTNNQNTPIAQIHENHQPENVNDNKLDERELSLLQKLPKAQLNRKNQYKETIAYLTKEIENYAKHLASQNDPIALDKKKILKGLKGILQNSQLTDEVKFKRFMENFNDPANFDKLRERRPQGLNQWKLFQGQIEGVNFTDKIKAATYFSNVTLAQASEVLSYHFATTPKKSPVYRVLVAIDSNFKTIAKLAEKNEIDPQAKKTLEDNTINILLDLTGSKKFESILQHLNAKAASNAQPIQSRHA